jgi:protein involved in polysaccharide export with SLBB domain
MAKNRLQGRIQVIKMKKHFSLIFLCVFTGFIFACTHPVIREISPQDKKGTQLKWDRETHKWVFKTEPPDRKAPRESGLPSFAQAVPTPPLKKEADRLIELQKRALTKEDYLRARFKGKEIIFPEDLPKNGEIEVKYKIGIDDILNIYIWKHEDLSGDVPVRSDGYASLPLIGDIHVEGLEIPEFRAVIEKKYDEYIEKPQITVTCKVPNSLQVSIVGAVEKPETYIGPATTTYILRGDRTLLSILSVVSIRSDADLEESYIIRGDKIIPVNLKALLEDGDTSQNIILCPQDTLVISEPLKEIVLLGEVKSPGRYKINRNSTVLDALSRAGGVNSKTADLYMAYLARDNDILPINFKRLLDHGNMSQNILLNDGDIIYIPNINENKTFVIGEVNAPGVRYFTDPMDLIEAISSCGGFRTTANRSQVVVVRGNPQKPEVYAVNVLKMMKGKSLERFYLLYCEDCHCRLECLPESNASDFDNNKGHTDGS